MDTYKSKYSRKEIEEKILSLGDIDLNALQQQVEGYEERIQNIEDELNNSDGDCKCDDPDSPINQEITNIKNDITKIKNIIVGKNGSSTTITGSSNTYELDPNYHYNVIENFDSTSVIKLTSDAHTKMDNGQELYVFAMTNTTGGSKIKVYFPDATKIVNTQGEVIVANDNTNPTEVTAKEVLEISIIKLEHGTFVRMS